MQGASLLQVVTGQSFLAVASLHCSNRQGCSWDAKAASVLQPVPLLMRRLYDTEGVRAWKENPGLHMAENHACRSTDLQQGVHKHPLKVKEQRRAGTLEGLPYTPVHLAPALDGLPGCCGWVLRVAAAAAAAGLSAGSLSLLHGLCMPWASLT